MSVTMPTLIFSASGVEAASSVLPPLPDESSSSSPHAATAPMHSARTAMSRSRRNFAFTGNPP